MVRIMSIFIGLILAVVPLEGMQAFLTAAHFTQVASTLRTQMGLTPRAPTAQAPGEQDVKDFAAIMAALKGITLKSPESPDRNGKQSKEEQELVRKSRVVPDSQPRIDLVRMVYEYLDERCIEIPCSRKLLPNYSPTTAHHFANYWPTACCISSSGELWTSYYVTPPHKGIFHNLVQRYDTTQKKWVVEFSSPGWGVSHIALLPHGLIVEGGSNHEYLRIMDGARATEQCKARVEENNYRFTLTDMLVCAPHKLIVGNDTGKISSFDISDFKQQKELVEGIKLQDRCGTVNDNHVQLVRLPNGFAAVTPHAIKRWAIEPKGNIKPLPLQEINASNGTILQAASLQNGMVYLVKVKDGIWLVFLNEALEVADSKNVRIVPWSDNKIVHYDDTFGVFGASFCEYTRKDFIAMGLIRADAAPSAAHKDEKIAQEPVESTVDLRGGKVIKLENPFVDFAILYTDNLVWGKNDCGRLAGCLYVKTAHHIQRMCNAYIKRNKQ